MDPLRCWERKAWCSSSWMEWVGEWGVSLRMVAVSEEDDMVERVGEVGVRLSVVRLILSGVGRREGRGWLQ